MKRQVDELVALINEYDNAKAERLKMKRVYDALDSKEKELKTKLIEMLETRGLTAAGGSVLKVTLRQEYEPTATTWSKVFVFIKKNDAFDLLQRRLNAAAVKERWNDNIAIPGIEKYPVLKLSESRSS